MAWIPAPAAIAMPMVVAPRSRTATSRVVVVPAAARVVTPAAVIVRAQAPAVVTLVVATAKVAMVPAAASAVIAPAAKVKVPKASRSIPTDIRAMHRASPLITPTRAAARTVKRHDRTVVRVPVARAARVRVAIVRRVIAVHVPPAAVIAARVVRVAAVIVDPTGKMNYLATLTKNAPIPKGGSCDSVHLFRK